MFFHIYILYMNTLYIGNILCNRIIIKVLFELLTHSYTKMKLLIEDMGESETGFVRNTEFCRN